jgi:mannonate dehydratase
MEQTWRWFGPHDKVTLSDALQAGAEGIVSALHEVPIGSIWPVDLIQKRQDAISAAGLEWTVVESLDVSERIKLRERGYEQDIANFISSLRNLAACGIRVVAYNLMPVFSWMRTDLAFPLASGALATRYDANIFAAFDIHWLARRNAEQDWSDEQIRAAREIHVRISQRERDSILSVILQGLPGGNGSFALEEVRAGLERYRDIDATAFRANVAEFLRAVCPVAEELGVRLCVHPDDPPQTLLGLPRIVSTENDLAHLLNQWPGEANGITFCTGALGVRADNDLLAMARRFANRIWFAHLRSTQRDADGQSFTEAPHLEGDADLVGIVIELIREERRRRADGDVRSLPFRPDHGLQLLNDYERNAQAGYPAVGRLRGLAELRGVICATERLLTD